MGGRQDILVLFDVDGTLTPSRLPIENDMEEYLQNLRKRVSVGLVGGSDLKKICEQVLPKQLRQNCPDPIEVCVNRFDFLFAENGLVAYKQGKLFHKQSIVDHIGEEKLQIFINFCLAYMSNLILPVKRGNFIEFRNGLINVCPVGRSCSQKEREQFNAYDNEHNIRKKFIDALCDRFGPHSNDPLDLVYSIGGQISFDVFPRGWDKTFCLDYVGNSFKEIHFFGDKTKPGGNDHEIYADDRTIGHTVTCPSDTLTQLRNLNF